MSDDDMGDTDDYDNDYDNENEEPDNDLENQYYYSEALNEDDPDAALESFKNVLALEKKLGTKGDWGFKSLEQIVKIYLKKKNFNIMLTNYKELLTYIKSAVTRNESEKTINAIIDQISTSEKMDLIENFYEITLDSLKEAKNNRLWFKIYLKLGKLYDEQQDYNKLQKIIKELYKACEISEGTDNQHRGTQLLEIYALEIQMHTSQKNNKKLKQLYEASLHIRSAIPHPLIMGVIRECGGKMHLREQEYEKSHTDFFEAFKNYDESGSPRRITCLKYLVLANMLMRSTINPFDSQEAKPYKDNPDIQAMTNLIGAYQNNNIKEFETILHKNRQTIMDDPFIREHIEILLRSIRTKVLIKLIKPYTKIRIQFIAQELNIDIEEVINLLISCILDQTVLGKIDQVNHVLELDQQQNIQGLHRYQAISKVASQLQTVQQTILQQFK
ncbi:unnamed protein product [Rotaria sp. Silwood2]|nr:unnamed protein product [Rotaria sp. Silwood2]CAF3184985.1 unnamed protein product [Rotaria sp. Silwood2]CAF3987992.1 unnamed protein product [Rotaria sp. Silwood2]CAF3993159.1 unnamed protein product [Rotaria sp. Silwood2]CAF4115941.1 unnamed protein product [Rotaria sp. Silwood2]